MVTQKKIERISQLRAMMEEKPNVFILNYSKVTVKDITSLRQKIKEVGSQYLITKNTLLKRTFNELGIEGLDKFLEGPTAIVISPTKPEEAAKILKEYSSQNPLFYFKGGYIEKKVEDGETLKVLATLPSREEMLRKVLFIINFPIQRLVNVLSSPVQSLYRVLNAIASNK